MKAGRDNLRGSRFRNVLLIPVHLLHIRTLPLGLAYIAAVLEENGYRVRVYDPLVHKKSSLVGCIREFGPDIIGISCMTPSFSRACRIAESIKQEDPGIPIVFGGVHPTVTPKETLGNESIDYIIMGEGEYTFLDLLKTLSGGGSLKNVLGLGWKSGSKAAINPPRPLIEDLDSLPLPARHLFPGWYFKRFAQFRGLWLKSTNMVSSRGCPYNCSYCSSRLMFGGRARFRSVKKVVDEIEHLLKRYKLDGVSFSDDTFTCNKKRAIEICREIRRRKLDFVWRIQARADTIDEEVVRELAESGCVQIDMGVESGSAKMLRVLQKGITPGQVVRAFRILKRYKIRTCATFMLGSPGEAREDIELTKQLAHRIDADYTQFFITTPFPGTKMYNDILANDPSLSRVSYDKFIAGGETLVPLIKGKIRPEELIRLQKELNEKFLRGAIKSLVNRWFLADMLALCGRRPDVLFQGIKKFIKTGRLSEVYRVFYSYYSRFVG